MAAWSASKMKWSNLGSLFLVILTFYINPAEGIKWLHEPFQVNKCKFQTANLTLEYMVEPGEEITQLQWIFNRTELIAYSSLNRGFNVEPKYQGRVNQSGKTGILLHNISSEDSGNYTLYLVVKWKENANIETDQTVQLNVIDAAKEPYCSCCAPVKNSNSVTESTTQRIVNQEKDSSGNKEISRILHNQTNQTSLMISVLVISIVGSVIGALRFFGIKYQKKRKNQKKSSTGKKVSEDSQEFQSLHAEVDI